MEDEKRYAQIFGDNLRAKMEEKGIRQIDIVNELGVPSPTVNTWARGERMPKLDRMQKLADYLHCDIFELIEDGETYKERRELSQVQRMYSALDRHGRDLVMTILRKEYERCT